VGSTSGRPDCGLDQLGGCLKAITSSLGSTVVTVRTASVESQLCRFEWDWKLDFRVSSRLVAISNLTRKFRMHDDTQTRGLRKTCEGCCRCTKKEPDARSCFDSVARVIKKFLVET
jgi:hypothetical protein